jgi:PEP-CTERM motif
MKTPATKSTRTQSLATVSASLAATVAGTHAATVQITLTGNNLTNTTNSLNADVTGDGTNDFTIAFVNQGSGVASFDLNANRLKAEFSGPASFSVDAQFAAGGVGKAQSFAYFATRNIKYLNPITFTDARINGGASTQGYLEVNAFNSSYWSHTVALTRLVFDDASTTLGTGGLSTSSTYTEWTPAVVPEPSSLALLALGAGGLAVRRRRQVA